MRTASSFLSPAAYFLPVLAWLAAFCPPAACVPEAAPRRTVWDRLMEDQSAVNLRRGYSLMEEQNYAAAADDFYKAARMNPESPWPRLLYGSALYWLGEPEKALSEFEEAMRLDPSNSMAYQLRGIVRARAGLYAKALEDFLRAEQFAPDRSDVKMNAGSVYQALGDQAKAQDYYRAAVAADPANPLYRYQLGMFYSRKGRDEPAAAQFEKAVSLFPGYEDALLELAVLREREGRISEAVKLYRRALSIKPRDSVARFRLAWALRKAGRAAEAGKALDGAFLLAPANEKGGISMALAYAGAAPGAEAEPQPQSPLFSALSKLPPGQEARIVIELLETPKAVLTDAPRGEKLAGRLQSAFKRPAVGYTKREYFLPASSPEERLKKAGEIAAESDKLLKGVSAGSDARLNFNIETSAPSSSRKDPKNKALYMPRDVGNDMGLWVMGDNWLDNAAEALEELEAAGPAPDPDFKLIKGLGYLLLGEPARALEEFSGGGAQAALGRGAAWVVAGSEEKALAACLEALRLEPGNKTALANRKWLEGAAR
ncbi:MAG: tetratricopeptide repeat protein [Elusimicrobia bacterium]|nr:tetratricopeptide repeat protein [Elusimicrobiota bacterium]